MNCARVMDLVGTPFVWGGRDPATGLDCWGLTKHALGLVDRRVVESFGPVPSWAEVDADKACELMQEERLAGDWEEVDWQPWALAWMGTTSRLHHIGVVLPHGDRRILLTTRKYGAVIMREVTLRQIGYSRIVYLRHTSWA